MELRLVSALLAQHRGKSAALKAARSEEELTFRSVKVIALSFLTICLGLLIALVGPKVFGQDSSISAVGGYVFLAGLAACLLASFHLAWMRAKPRRPPAIPEAITQPDLKADAAELLQSQNPSITESTTRLMDDEIVARPRAQESSGRQTG